MKLRPSSAFFAGALCCATSLAASPLLLYPDADEDRVRCIDTALAQGYSAPVVAASISSGYSLEPGYWSVDPYAESAGDEDGPAPARALSFFAGNSGEADAAWALSCRSAVDLDGPANSSLDLHTVYASDIPPAGMAFGFLLICILGREPLHRRKRRWGEIKPMPALQ